jgi:TP901 family phage tail tape measure protein
MDTRTPREKLNDLAGAAGRLGITSKAMVEEFVDGADKIGVALGDDLGEGAVDVIGKLAIAFGEDKTKGLRGAMLATGSALNEIVQNSPAQAQPVIEFTQQLSGVGQQAHLTQAQIMGFAAALDQNNQEMATASTVMSQLITKMYQDPARFAQMAGMEVKKFTDLIHTDMNQAIVEWLQHVNKLGDMSVLAGKFDQLKMDGTRAVGVLSTLAGHIDQVTEAQRIATEAYAEGTSVIEEFNVQNTTVQAEIDKARKRFADLSIELGSKLMPLARYAITSGSAGIKILNSLANFVYRFRGEIGLLAAALVAYNAVLAISWAWKQRTIVQLKAMYALEAMQHTLTKARTVATAAYNLVMGRLTGNLTRATVAQAELNAAMSANVIGAIVTAVVVFIGVMKSAYDQITKLDAATQALNEVEQESRSRIADERVEMDRLISVVNSATSSEKERKKALGAINGKLMEKHLGNLTEEEIRTGKAESRIRAYNEALKAQIKNEILLGKLKEALAKQAAAEDGEFDMSWIDKVTAATAALAGFFVNGFTGAKDEYHRQMKSFQDYAVNEQQKAIDAINEKIEENNRKQTEIHEIGEVVVTPSGTNKDNRTSTPGGSGGGLTAAEIEEAEKRKKALLAEENRQRNEARKRMKEEEDLAKAERQKADLEAKQEYQQRLITEEEYHDRRYQNEQAFIARLQQIRESGYATEAERQEVQNMSLDALINEANYQQEQRKKQMQDTLQLMEQSYQADQIALEQMRYSGEIATEEEYNRRKIEAEIDYQRERLRIIREAGGDTMEADNALQRALLEQTKEGQAQRLKELNKEMDDAALRGDYDRQLSIQQQMLDEKLITQEQYEHNITDLTRQAEQDRQAIRESYAQAAGQLLSSTSSLFSAMQSREEARVDKKYKTLIDRAKKNGKDTSKLEEQQEQEKLEIKKKYADKQFALTVLEIIAQGALGIQKIWAEWGWNPPVAVGLTATEAAVAAIQLATAKAQRDQAAGLYTGGYSDEVEGYTGDGDPRDMAGVVPVHKREFVINHEALKIPVVRRVADVIDSAQKRKAYNIQDTTRVLQNTIIRQTGLAQGGYSGNDARTPAAGSSSPLMDDQGIINSIERNTRMLQQLLDDGITILQLRKRIRHEEQLEKNASRS